MAGASCSGLFSSFVPSPWSLVLSPWFLVLGSWFLVLFDLRPATCDLPSTFNLQPSTSHYPRPRFFPCASAPLRESSFSYLRNSFSRRGAEPLRIILPETTRRSTLPGQPSRSCSLSRPVLRAPRPAHTGPPARSACAQALQAGGPRTTDHGPRTTDQGLGASHVPHQHSLFSIWPIPVRSYLLRVRFCFCGHQYELNGCRIREVNAITRI